MVPPTHRTTLTLHHPHTAQRSYRAYLMLHPFLTGTHRTVPGCSIYGLSVGGPKILGPVTPLGGLCLIAGWVMLATK